MTRFTRIAPAAVGQTPVRGLRPERTGLAAALASLLPLRNFTIATGCLLGAALSVLSATAARAEDAVTLTLKDHAFTPAELSVPAGKAFTIVVKNEDSAAEEFDSDDLHVEKVIAANSSGTIHIKPLKPGTYKFAGEYHEATAKGILVAK